MSQKPVFVIITSETCGACVSFKDLHEQQLFEKLQNSDIGKRIKMVNIHISGKDPKELTKYHPQLIKWCGWFPFFAILNPKTWNDPNAALQGDIFGGRFIPEKEKSEWSGANLTAEGIFLWIQKILSQLRIKKPVAQAANTAFTPAAQRQIRFVSAPQTSESEWSDW